MKIGDKVKLLVDDYYMGHEIGSEGVILSEWWTQAGITMFGVKVDGCDSGDGLGWSYDNTQLEVIK